MGSHVVVIGAGMAGLAAARELSSSSEVTLLEARSRAGGRAYTLVDPRSPVPLELGAEFIHGEPDEIFSLLRETGRARCDTADTHAEFRNGRLVDEPDIESDVEPLLKRMKSLDSDLSVDEFLRRFGSDPGCADAARSMRAMVEGFDAADPAKASVRAILQEWRGEAGVGGASSRPLGGYGPLVEHLLQSTQDTGARAVFDAMVERVAWSDGGVRVRGSREGEAFALDADAAIVTLPLGVLQGHEVVFDPPLPRARVDAMNALAMGPVYKAVLVCEEPFWERVHDGCLHDVAFFHDEEAPFPTIWTSLPLRSTTLVAWAGGPRAERLMGKSAEGIYERVFASLERMFGRGARDAVQTIYLHDWESDPFSRGAYSYVNVGGMGARERFGAPLDNVLFFAGEHTALGGEAGTVGGALRSGIRAAREVQAALT